jgi:hypothetical protein
MVHRQRFVLCAFVASDRLSAAAARGCAGSGLLSLLPSYVLILRFNFRCGAGERVEINAASLASECSAGGVSGRARGTYAAKSVLNQCSKSTQPHARKRACADT